MIGLGTLKIGLGVAIGVTLYYAFLKSFVDKVI